MTSSLMEDKHAKCKDMVQYHCAEQQASVRGFLLGARSESGDNAKPSLNPLFGKEQSLSKQSLIYFTFDQSTF